MIDIKNKKPYIILAIFSILVFAIAFLIKPQEYTLQLFAYESLLNIGFIIITIVLVNILWFLLGGDPTELLLLKLVDSLELLADGFRTGVTRFFTSSTKFAKSDEWLRILRSSKKRVDMQGYSLHVWTRTDDFANTLIDLAKKDVKVRIMIMDFENEHFTAGLNFSQIKSISHDSIKSEIDTCSAYMNMITKELEKIGRADNFEFIRCKTGLIECQICRMDDVQHITPYLYSVNASGSPLFIIKGEKNDIFKKYENEFESLWKLNKTT